jgi:hypothetical protein
MDPETFAMALLAIAEATEGDHEAYDEAVDALLAEIEGGPPAE